MYAGAQLGLTFAATNRAGNARHIPVRLQCRCTRATALANLLKPAWFGEPMLGHVLYLVFYQQVISIRHSFTL
jgi:hypothetical protein